MSEHPPPVKIVTEQDLPVMEVRVIRDTSGMCRPDGKPLVRVWCDGCFDLLHWGHANALRQAKMLGDVLVVGIHSDEEIAKFKGPCVMNAEERYAAASACKWVDEVVTNVPYVTYLSCLNKFNIDFCCHGEDLSTDEWGRDSYQEVKDAGRFKYIKRSEGVSTTELVGRMILKSKEHLAATLNADPKFQTILSPDLSEASEALKVFKKVSAFLPSTRNIFDFSSSGTNLILKNRERASSSISSSSSSSSSSGVRRVYIDGAFDLFHVGHIEALRQARLYGDYLIVGVHNDATVNAVKGANLPIMNLYERVLTVLACRYVDEVIIGAPWKPTQEQITQLRITTIVRGSCSDYPADAPEPHSTAREMNIYEKFDSKHAHMTTSSIVKRILENQIQFEARNAKKASGLLKILEQQKESWDQKFQQAKSVQPDPETISKAEQQQQ